MQEKNICSIKIRPFHIWTQLSLFINSNLIPVKFGGYLNTGNSHQNSLKIQLKPPFPKQQDKGKEAQDTSKTWISVLSRDSEKDKSYLIRMAEKKAV